MNNSRCAIAPARAVVRACLAVILSTAPLTGHCALTLNNTRIVFDSDKRSTSVVVKNPSTSHYAVQTWINTEADDETTPVPFIITPPLFSIVPTSEQLVQINSLPNTLPQDRESLFFFNMQEIPNVSEQPGNQLNIALRTRIKLFYRPAQLKGTPSEQLQALRFSVVQKQGEKWLRIHNPSPFYITFIGLAASTQGQTYKLDAPPMVAPLSEHDHALAGTPLSADSTVRFSVINDFGGHTEPLTQPIATTH